MKLKSTLAIVTIMAGAFYLVRHETIASRPSGAVPSSEAAVATLPPDPQRGNSFAVQADPGSEYQLVEWTRVENGNRRAVTRRAHGGKVEFATLEVDCAYGRFRSREADTLEKALTNTLGPLAPVEDGTVPADIAHHVCSL